MHCNNKSAENGNILAAQYTYKLIEIIQYTYTHTHLMAFVWESGEQYQKGKTNLDFTEARNKWVAVASAGPYANLHLVPDRQPCQQPTTQFLQALGPSCRPTNSIKALKANNIHTYRAFGLSSIRVNLIPFKVNVFSLWMFARFVCKAIRSFVKLIWPLVEFGAVYIAYLLIY